MRIVKITEDAIEFDRGKRSHRGSKAKYRVVREFARHERVPVRTGK